MNILDCEQHSPEWYAARRGQVTASRIADLKPLKKGGESQACRKYKRELLSEILTGRTTDHYVSPAMDWGIDTEPLARTAYEQSRGVTVERVGYVLHPTLPRAGCSPDGLVGDDGLVEIKCPTTAVHLDYLIAGTVPEDYVPQMYWQMACCEREWCDFVSFDPRLDRKFQLFVIRLERDNQKIAEWEDLAAAFISDLNSMAGVLEAYNSEIKPATLEAKLRASIKKAKGYPQYDAELVAAFNDNMVP